MLLSVFGKPKLTEHPVVRAVAERLGASAAQVLIAWGIYRGFSVIPKSSQKERIISNFNRIELTPQDYEEICSIGRKEPSR
jgi:L-glyceraldehyde reductase